MVRCGPFRLLGGISSYSRRSCSAVTSWWVCQPPSRRLEDLGERRGANTIAPVFHAITNTVRISSTRFCARLAGKPKTGNRDKGLSGLPQNRRFAFSAKNKCQVFYVFTSYRSIGQVRYAPVHLPRLPAAVQTSKPLPIPGIAVGYHQ